MLFGRDYLKPCSVPRNAGIYETGGAFNGGIISIYNDGEPLYISSDAERKRTVTNIDIISDIFFMLTRYEEVVSGGKKDKHGRFPAAESLAYKNNFLLRPIVNEHIELLWSWLDSFSTGCRRVDRWNGKAFAACISHDVDHVMKNKGPYSALRHALGVLLRTMSLKKTFEYLKDYLKNRRDHTKDPYWTFGYLVDLERKYEFNSSFYFMASKLSDPDCRYDIGDVKVRDLIAELEKQGREIGLHGSLQSCSDKALMLSEKSRLDEIVKSKPYGCRQHYLKFQIPVTWRYQAESGLLYDTSLTFAGHEGFRCGMCLPFKPFDIYERKVLDIYEIPLLIMEGTLQSSMYRNLSPKEALSSIIDIIETVKKYGGVFSVLWHNSSFDLSFEGWHTVYEDMMGYLGSSGCIGLSGREIIEAMRLSRVSTA